MPPQVNQSDTFGHIWTVLGDYESPGATFSVLGTRPQLVPANLLTSMRPVAAPVWYQYRGKSQSFGNYAEQWNRNKPAILIAV